jgi:hypothetical protein
LSKKVLKTFSKKAGGFFGFPFLSTNPCRVKPEAIKERSFFK